MQIVVMDSMKPLLFTLLGALSILGAQGYMRACVYTNWSQFNAAPNIFFPALIPPGLCTHIVFAFADITDSNVTATEFNDAEMYDQLNELKQKRPQIQLILAVGGWAAGGEKFSRLVSSESSMDLFADNLIAYLRKYNLDGANIDWQYPTSRQRGSDVVDRLRYTKLLQILRNSFEEEAVETGTARLSLSATLEADIKDARGYYQIAEIAKVLDFAFLMAYDLHGDWEPNARALHHSPLLPDIRDFVTGWVQEGFPSDQLVLGVAGFGRSFTLTSEPVGSAVGQGVVKGGQAGSFSNTEGLLDYGEICFNLANKGWTSVWLEKQGVPVAYGNTTKGWQWVGYDDPRSVTQKAHFIMEQDLAGVMFWSLEHDDYSNLCGNKSWPLLRTLASELPINSSKARIPPRPTADSTLTYSNRTSTRSRSTTEPTSVRSSTKLFGTPHRSANASQVRATLLSTSSSSSSSVSSTSSSSSASSSSSSSSSSSLSPVPPSTPSSSLSFSYGTAGLVPTLSTAAVTNNSMLEEDRERGLAGRKTVQSPAYRQCNLGSVFGPALKCPPTRGKPGDRNVFYLHCFSGFFAIECHCLPGHFFNRCLQLCDVNANFRKCPIVH